MRPRLTPILLVAPRPPNIAQRFLHLDPDAIFLILALHISDSFSVRRLVDFVVSALVKRRALRIKAVDPVARRVKGWQIGGSCVLANEPWQSLSWFTISSAAKRRNGNQPNKAKTMRCHNVFR
jgi:hypothetical protein